MKSAVSDETKFKDEGCILCRNKAEWNLMKYFDFGKNFYRPSFLWTELNTSLEFKDILGKEREHMFFHEYIHFLQDITTVYGYANFSKIMNLIKATYHKIKERKSAGNTELHIPISFFDDEFRDINNNLFENYLKYTDDDEEYDQITVDRVELINVNVENMNVKTYKIHFNGDRETFFGAHAIFESTCHILEKKCYNLTPPKLKIPYDMAEKICVFYSEYFAEHKDYILDLCEYSLMFFNSAEVFVMILEAFKNDADYFPGNSNDFYDYMFKIVQPTGKYNVETFFEKQKNELVADVRGVFKSELYAEFHEWVIETIEKGFCFKRDNKFIFSRIYKCNPTGFLCYAIPGIGMPATYNQEGQIFTANKNFNVSKCIYLSRAVSEVFDNIIFGKRKCGLKEACIFANSVTGNRINITEFCDEEPWKNFPADENAELCGFCQVWKTLGLSNIKIV